MTLWDTIPGGSDLLRTLGPAPSFGDATIVSLELSSETCRLVIETVSCVTLPDVRVAFDLTGLVNLRLEKAEGPDILDELTVRVLPGPIVADDARSSWRTGSLIELTLSSLSGLSGKLTARALGVSIVSIGTDVE